MPTDVNETADTSTTSVETADDTGTNDVQDTGTETEEVAEDYTLEDLLKIGKDDFDEFDDEANHTGMKPLHHWMQHVPQDVRKHLANLRSSYTRKTQELADERAALRAELEAERAKIQAERKSMYNGDMATKVQELAADDQEYDLFDREGMQKEIKRQAALMMQEMLKPAQEQMQVETRRFELQKFAAEHPDIKSDEYRMPIAKMLQQRPELKLEDAYYIVKARVDAEKLQAERKEIQEQRNNRRSTFQKTSTGKSQAPKGAPRFASAWEAYQYHAQEAAKKKN